MEVVQKPIGQLHSDPNNARKHDPKNIQAIKGSLAKFKQQKPIVITKDNIVLAGNGTLQAARELEWQHIDCVVTDLESYNATAFALADNRTAELAEWDEGVLAETLKSLDDFDFDIGDIGFDDSFLPDEEPTQGNIEDDLIPDTEDNEFGVQLGDVWKLGEHRLMCGDSTKKENVELLMNGEKADMAFTSPPYNAGKSEKLSGNCHSGDNKYNNYNDNKSHSDYLKMLVDFTENCLVYVDLLVCNMQQLSGNKIAFLEYLNEFKNNVIDISIWDKGHAAPVIAPGVMSNRFEYMVFVSNKTSPSRSIPYSSWRGKFQNVFCGDRQNNNIYSKTHAATFPVSTPEHYISNISDDSKTVLDPFMGTGSTLIACEKTNRKCYGMELDPHYCSVIIKRWQDFTGQTASKVA